jgi:predicted kinase
MDIIRHIDEILAFLDTISLVNTINKSKKNTLLLLCGLPGSGKTTFANSFKTQFQYISERFTIKHICFDDIFESLAETYSHENWHKGREVAWNATRKLLEEQSGNRLEI